MMLPFRIAELMRLVRADLLGRGILTTADRVKFGGWQHYVNEEPPRVIFSIAPFQATQDAEPALRGPVEQDGERPAIWASLHERTLITVIAMAEIDETLGEEEQSEANQRAVANLREEVYAALRHVLGNPVEQVWGFGLGQWPRLEDEERMYGSVCQFEIFIRTPLRDVRVVPIDEATANVTQQQDGQTVALYQVEPE